ncbi:putative DNA repair and recombination protein RecA [Klebsormidium nitens]|uniref:Putative DNA repair and recombination protein RecA n=1 Tax=Klebsormidium nitens TaxID=105231 RepID=A0A1Y1I963_KLENI|nr:putative DNA repair and recombination protein RecA [Klebsormidium nitens]|eukprot:GAQ87514.1 putative DNA repair and recombination protein RecA [Klebsormidium nitens]
MMASGALQVACRTASRAIAIPGAAHVEPPGGCSTCPAAGFHSRSGAGALLRRNPRGASFCVPDADLLAERRERALSGAGSSFTGERTGLTRLATKRITPVTLDRRRGAAVAARAPRRSAASSAATLDKDAGQDESLAASRRRALEDAMAEINAQYGKGTVTRLGATGVSSGVETFPSGSLALDYILGGGLPRGRIVEVYGPESSGKTTLALHAIAEVQKAGGNCLLIDAEHAFDPDYSGALGVNMDELVVCQPDNGDMALNTADHMIRSSAVDLIVVDSVSALVPKAELEGDIGNQLVGSQARLMSQALRKLASSASKARCTIIFINQIRFKIGVIYGSPEVTSGGQALKFFASLRLEIRNTGRIKGVPEAGRGEVDVGIRTRIRVTKSKVSLPYRTAEQDIIFKEGISHLGCIVDVGELLGLIMKKGAWYSYGDTKIGQGREKVVAFLRENDDIRQTIEKDIRARIAQDSASSQNGRGASSAFVAPMDSNGGLDELPTYAAEEDLGFASDSES